MLGLCEFQTREFKEALTHLEQAYQLGLPNELQITDVALYHIALLETRSGNYEKTIALCRMLMRSTPKPERVMAVAGVAALRRPVFPQDLPEADRELAYLLGKAVASIDIRSAGGWQQDFEDVIAAYPKAPNVNYWYATVLLANDPDKGIDALKRELAINPDHVPALVQLVFEYLRRSEPESAKPFAERAAKAAPDNFATRASLGRVLTLTEEISRGIQELERSVKLAPDSPQAHLWLAQAYTKVGRQQDALRERAEFARLKKAAEAVATPNLLR
jgi:predicted Zn-dependent protease